RDRRAADHDLRQRPPGARRLRCGRHLRRLSRLARPDRHGQRARFQLGRRPDEFGQPIGGDRGNWPPARPRAASRFRPVASGGPALVRRRYARDRYRAWSGSAKALARRLARSGGMASAGAAARRDSPGSRAGGSSVSADRGLRVLMTADAVGGVWQYATDLSAALTAAGNEVTLAVLGPAASPEQRRSAEAIEGLTLIETGLPLDWLSDGPEPVEQAAAALARLAVETDADLVHCNMPTLAGAAQLPRPLITAPHGRVATWSQAAKNEPPGPDHRSHRARKGRRHAAPH